MTPIISRRHPLKFYLSLFFAVAFFLVLGIAMIAIYIRQSNDGTTTPKALLMPILGIATIFMAGYTLYRYYKNAPKIIIDKKIISFNTESFSLSDIQNLVLNGKQSFPYLLSVPMEAAALHFRDGTTKFIFDDMYDNSWELKSYLNQVVLGKQHLSIPANFEVSKADLESDYYDTFKNSQLLSLRGISLWVPPCIFLFKTLTSYKSATTPMLFFLFFLWLFGLRFMPG